MNYAYWLANIPEIGNRTIYRLLSQAGSAEELYSLSESQLNKLKGIGTKEIENIQKSKAFEWEKEYDRICGEGIIFLSAEEARFPEKLKRIANPPYALYVKGRLPEPEKKSVAIVGARMCSEYGYAVAKELGRKLAVYGVQVISGMAKGIDSAGQWGALEKNGGTFAVLGCGVDICYPSSGRNLYHRILERGGILSEYAPGMKPHPGFFPCRNRLISGLSDVVVVVEAKERSGSLITADLALEQGKDIYAVPGRISDPLSTGCNRLILQGAGILADLDEFLKELDLCTPMESYEENFKKLLLEKEESLVYSCLDLQPKSIEELLTQTGLSMTEMAVILANLVQKEFITEIFKNYYIRRI